MRAMVASNRRSLVLGRRKEGLLRFIPGGAVLAEVGARLNSTCGPVSLQPDSAPLPRWRAWPPLAAGGIGPDQLKLKSLLDRLRSGAIEEIIVATNPTVEATGFYWSRLLKPLEVGVTRIGMGIPVGSDLEYVDEVTMLKSLEGDLESPVRWCA